VDGRKRCSGWVCEGLMCLSVRYFGSLVGVVEYVYCTCISNANPLGLELVSELQGEVTPLVCLAKASEWQDLIVLAYFGSIAFHIL